MSLHSMLRLFFTDKKFNWDEFGELVKAQYGADDNFTKVVELNVPLLKLIRNARDSLEHHNAGVTITDFLLKPDGSLSPPSIKIDFRGSQHDRVDISWFMQEATKALLIAFEMFVVHVCAKYVQPFAGMPIVVAPLPESFRKAWHVRFAYGMYYADGQFAPMG